MVNHGNWPKELEKRLKGHCLKAEGDRDKFKELVLADEVLMKEKELDVCKKKARRMGFFKEAKLSRRYVFSHQLDEEELKELDRMLADDEIKWSEMKQKFPGFKISQFRNRAKIEGIKINKGKPGRKAAEVSEAGAAGVAKEDELTPEQELIKRREAKDITPEGFIAGLMELKPVSDLKIYWGIIEGQLKEKKEKGKAIRNSDLLPFAVELGAEGAKELLSGKVKKEKKNLRERILSYLRGVLGMFVEWGLLSRFTVGRPGRETHEEYICNLPRFYTPEELKKLIPDSEKPRVLSGLVGNYEPGVLAELVPDSIRVLLFGLLSAKPKPLEVLSSELSAVIGGDLLDKLLEYLVDRELIRETKKGFALSEMGMEVGIDAQSIRTLDAIALENAVLVREESPAKLSPSLEGAERILAEEMQRKMITPIVLSGLAGKDSVNFTFFAEVLFGNQNTDLGLLNYVLPRTEADVIVVSGLVQGAFVGLKVDKRRLLSEAFGKIGTQYALAGELNRRLEQIAKTKVVDMSGDDDWGHAVSVARVLQLGEGKWWNYGMSTSSLSAELKRRLAIAEYYNKLGIQWEKIILYQRRIYRSLLNADEVEQIIGVRKSEYRLIIEILVAKRNNFNYPKDYEKVVNVEALFGDIGNRVVTADPASIVIGDMEIKIVHNIAFSDITQYVDPMLPPEMIMRNLAARGIKLPFALVNCHQEKFGFHYLQGHRLINLPGMQNTAPSSRFDLKAFHTRVLSSKSLRQETFRKEPVTPGVVNWEVLRDGRERYHLWNNAFREIVESQKSEPEITESVCLLTDLQHGSIAMCPELEIAFIDYCLYECGSTRLWLNGDILQGTNYFQTFSENRPYRLVSIDSQQRFTDIILFPLILNAPNLRDFFCWLGNHCWNTFGSNISGANHLAFLEYKLQGYIEGMKMASKDMSLKNALAISRIRILNSHNPYGDIVNWPYFTDTVAGFKSALSHIWRVRGRGRTPIHDASRWMRGMAKTAGDINVMFGGHIHSFWMSMEAEKLLVQLAASATLSGWEMGLGVMSTVLFTRVIFSNRNGITIELVPWQFLENYKLQSPAYKGKEELLRRPKRGTIEYKYGKMSPYIEEAINKVTQYREE